ncbi:MAG: glycosyltransferase, partial [Anaerolineae bacterium]|nr:glycosyltransferase [Anaerolineae bacterium]
MGAAAGKSTTLIGIDASRAVSTAPTGTEAYSYHLIRAMLPLMQQKFAVTLYMRYKPQSTSFPDVDIKVMPFPRLWSHLRLSWEMVVSTPELLFVPAHVLPVIHPVNSLVTVHDLGYRLFPESHPPGQRFYLNCSTRWNVRQAAHVIADSEATREAIVTHYSVPPSKITVAYPGYDSNLKRVENPSVLDNVKRRYGIHGDYILHIGRIQPRKNLGRLIDAFQVLRS